MRVFVTGGTGFIGRPLVQALAERGDQVVVLSRTPREGLFPPGVEQVQGDVETAGDWGKRVAGCDAVVHLAGESIGARRLTVEWKERVRASRIAGTKNVVAAAGGATLVSASGADVYPFDDSEQLYAEDAPVADTFLGTLCRDWEHEARAAKGRVCLMRTGVVLGKGGALARMATPFKMFFGGPVGSGRQWFSWVALADVVGAYLFALDTAALAGPVNLVAPAVRQREFARALGKALGRPSWMPVPGFMLKLAAGELSEYLLHGRRVVAAALEKTGYEFRHAEAAGALREALA